MIWFFSTLVQNYAVFLFLGILSFFLASLVRGGLPRNLPLQKSGLNIKIWHLGHDAYFIFKVSTLDSSQRIL